LVEPAPTANAVERFPPRGTFCVRMLRHSRRGRAHPQYHGIGLELAGFALDARRYVRVNGRLDPHSYKDLR